MPAVSKKQRIAAAIAEHHPEEATGAAKDMAESMSKEQLRHFSATKEKGLPEKKAAVDLAFAVMSKIAAAAHKRGRRQ